MKLGQLPQLKLPDTPLGCTFPTNPQAYIASHDNSRAAIHGRRPL
jgi:hypothetical protein